MIARRGKDSTEGLTGPLLVSPSGLLSERSRARQCWPCRMGRVRAFATAIAALAVLNVIALSVMFGRYLGRSPHETGLQRHGTSLPVRGVPVGECTYPVMLVWQTGRDTFSLLNQRVVESVLKHNPDVCLQLYSDTLPLDWLAPLADLGYSAEVRRVNLLELSRDLPGQTWLKTALSSNSDFLPTHLSDFTRLVLLYKYGGVYLDTDALMLKPLPHTLPSWLVRVDFLQLEPSCDWCLDKKWYLPNGVMGMPAKHPLLERMLARIDQTPYDPTSRLAIGPRFLTETFIAAQQLGIPVPAILDEPTFFPVPGPKVGDAMQATGPTVDSTWAVIQADEHALSFHLFEYTFKEVTLVDNSLVDKALKSVQVLPPGLNLCQCMWDTVAAGLELCLPLSVILRHSQRVAGWWLPAVRMCASVRADPSALVHSTYTMRITTRHGGLRLPNSGWAQELELEWPWASEHKHLGGIQYVHTGNYCNDDITVTILRDGSQVYQHGVFVHAPCWTAAEVLAPRSKLPVRKLPENWAFRVAPAVPSQSLAELRADPVASTYLDTCLRQDLEVPAAGQLRVGVIVSATGKYVQWLDDFILSGQQFLFLDCEVHYFIFTDPESARRWPSSERVHLLEQSYLGWPYDSELRHQLYYRAAPELAEMDYLMVEDADTTFVGPIGRDALGSLMAVAPAFFFAQSFDAAPWEIGQIGTSARVYAGEGKCYYAGGAFGGSVRELMFMMLNTTWMMEYDSMFRDAHPVHDDESYLNRFFLDYPPTTSLPGSYVYPEPPADRAWGMSGHNWKAAFPPKVSNLGARKWLAQEPGSERPDSTLQLGTVLSAESPTDLTPGRHEVADVTVVVHFDDASQVSAGLTLQVMVEQLAALTQRWHGSLSVLVVDSISSEPLQLGTRYPSMKYVHKPWLQGAAKLAQLLQASVSTGAVLVLQPGTVPTWQLAPHFLDAALHSGVPSPPRVIGLCRSQHVAQHPASECLERFGRAQHWRCLLCDNELSIDTPAVFEQLALVHRHRCTQPRLDKVRTQQFSAAMLSTQTLLQSLRSAASNQQVSMLAIALQRGVDSGALWHCQHDAQVVMPVRAPLAPQSAAAEHANSKAHPELFQSFASVAAGAEVVVDVTSHSGQVSMQPASSSSASTVACWGEQPQLGDARSKYNTVVGELIGIELFSKKLDAVLLLAASGDRLQFDACIDGKVCVFLVRRAQVSPMSAEDAAGLCERLDSELAEVHTVHVYAQADMVLGHRLSQQLVWMKLRHP